MIFFESKRFLFEYRFSSRIQSPADNSIKKRLSKKEMPLFNKSIQLKLKWGIFSCHFAEKTKPNTLFQLQFCFQFFYIEDIGNP
jgi:hypothetical protein